MFQLQIDAYHLDISHSVMVSPLDKQIITREFESYRVPHTSGLMLQLSKA